MNELFIEQFGDSLQQDPFGKFNLLYLIWQQIWAWKSKLWPEVKMGNLRHCTHYLNFTFFTFPTVSFSWQFCHWLCWQGGQKHGNRRHSTLPSAWRGLFCNLNVTHFYYPPGRWSRRHWRCQGLSYCLQGLRYPAPFASGLLLEGDHWRCAFSAQLQVSAYSSAGCQSRHTVGWS